MVRAKVRDDRKIEVELPVSGLLLLLDSPKAKHLKAIELMARLNPDMTNMEALGSTVELLSGLPLENFLELEFEDVEVLSSALALFRPFAKMGEATTGAGTPPRSAILSNG